VIAKFGAFCGFGKLSSRADFVHIGPRAEPFERFDDWLTNCVEWAHARSGAAWCDAFRVGGVRAFVYRVGSSASLIVGALAPSRDEAGRLFPISVAAPVALGPDFAGAPQLLPFACEGAWQEAGECVAALLSAPLTDSGKCIAAMSAPRELSFVDAQLAYAAWADTLTLTELWLLIGGEPGPDGLHGILRFVAAAVQPYRSREFPETQLSLRLPLGAAGGAAVCFWLDVVRRLVGWRTTVPSFFWSHDGASGQLTVHLGVPPAATVSQLWLPTSERDEFCDLSLSLDVPVVQRLAPLSERAERALAHGDTAVASLLAALEN
jgi:type VI secretion system ImpM family protein